MPYRLHSPETDLGPNLPSTAGTGSMNDSLPREMEQTIHRRREPTRTHQDGGNGHALRRPTGPPSIDTPVPTGIPMSNRERTPDIDMNGLGSTPRPRNEPRVTLAQPKRRRKQIKLASLNMNGRGDRSQDKWGSISNVIKKRHIAVLALQETHPSEEMQETVKRRFRNHLYITHSADPDRPGSVGGVSIAMNKSIVDVKNVTHRPIIPGRVMLIEIPWNEGDRLRIMNIYAPANNAEKEPFWNTLAETLENDESLWPDVMMGDFNLVENPEIDRLNNRRGADPMTARNTMSKLTTELNLTDGWRRRNPQKRGYTFTGTSQSRLDRIYTKEDIFLWCTDWKIEHPSLKSDHNLISVQISSENMPFIGKGRWAIPVNLLKNRGLKKKTQELAKALQQEVERSLLERHETDNPQVALKTFKTKIIDTYRDYQKMHQPKLENAIKSLQRELEGKANEPNLSTEDILDQSALISERINALEKKRKDGARLLSSARNRLEGETLSKHWIRSAKESTPRDTIRALKNPLDSSASHETRSDKMAEVARRYHEQLLSVDRNPSEEPNRGKLREVITNVTAKLSPDNIGRLKKEIGEEEVAAALMDSANDKAAGLDGIPTELWKLLHQQYKSAEEKKRHQFCNISLTLSKVFSDISKYGIVEGTNFNEGWMCPIYKKKKLTISQITDRSLSSTLTTKYSQR